MASIGIIGFQDDVMGFGLAGVKKAVEVKRDASKEEILNALELIKEVAVLLINESSLEKIKDEKVLNDMFVVTIPNKEQGFSNEAIDDLVRETLGITIANNDGE